MSADTMYFLQKNEIVHKPSTPEIGKEVNALNLLLKTPAMFSKST